MQARLPRPAEPATNASSDRSNISGLKEMSQMTHLEGLELEMGDEDSDIGGDVEGKQRQLAVQCSE